MVYELLFSATGRSRRVLEIVSRCWEGDKERLDLSDPDLPAGRASFHPDDLCIVTVSVFEGRVPAPALTNLRKLQGNGARALLVAVFGNRAVDDCLLELKNELTERGFVCFAAIEASVQHSLLPRVAMGRPDADDVAELTGFANKARELLASRQSFGGLNVPGKFPYVEMGGVSFKPRAGEGCIGCGQCAAACPVRAIPPEAPHTTEEDKCITCMRCAAVCPVGARDFPQELTDRVLEKMWPVFEARKPNRFYAAE